jgi:uncharacterized protein (TIGR03083 family)
MAAHPEVAESIRHLRDESGRMRDELAGLSADEWNAASNCPPWPVRRLVAHIVENAQFIRTNVERGVAGTLEPGLSREEREQRLAVLAETPPAEVAAQLDSATADLEGVLDRLSADELERICYHPAGNRPARWYAQQRLAEVAFHRWDVGHSLGRDATLDEGVARFLLPMLMESNMPRVYPRGPKGQGRLRLQVEGAPELSWLCVADGETLQVQRGGAGETEATITAPAGTLALLIYGRGDLREAERQGRAHIEGDRAVAERFKSIFPGP